MRCAIYARVSKERCNECSKTRELCQCPEFRGQDTDNQISQLKAFATSQQWDVVDEYIDHVSAGGTVEREQFNLMMEGASRRRFDVVLFWALDRFSREGVRATLNHLTRLDHYGVGWRSFSEQYLDSTGMFKDAVIAILAAIARQERIRISERTKAGLATARRKGKILGRPRVTVDLKRARMLRAEGYSIQETANRMGLKKSVVHKYLIAAERAGETTA